MSKEEGGEIEITADVPASLRAVAHLHTSEGVVPFVQTISQK